MLAPWAMEEMKTVDLADKRLDKRVAKILSALGQRPTASIPAACGGYKEMKAAYRFFANDKVTAQKVLQPHYEQTKQRIAENPVALLVQDTTEMDLTRPDSQVDGTGPLDGSSRRGIHLHLMEAFTEDGTPLGAVWVDMWARPDQEIPLSQKDKQKQRKVTPIEEKESYRWLEGLRRARAVAEKSPTTTCVFVADSEADIYEVIAANREAPNTRSIADPVPATTAAFTENRRRSRSKQPTFEPGGDAAPVLFTQQISVRGRKPKMDCERRGRRQPRQSRTAVVEVRAARVTLNPPRRPDQKTAPATVNAVLVTEVDPPEGDEPVEWLLITSLPIDTA